MLNTNGLRRTGQVAMTVIATGLALFSARYFTLDKALFLAEQASVYAAHLGPLLPHVGGGVTGPPPLPPPAGAPGDGPRPRGGRGRGGRRRAAPGPRG